MSKSKLPDALKELKRRGVFGTVALYLAAAWVVIEVADTVFPRLGLPDGTVTLLVWAAVVGLPVVALLAWSYQITSEGIRWEGEGVLGERLVGGSVIAVAVIAVGIAVFWGIDRGRDAGPVDDHVVAVLPFDAVGDSAALALAEQMVYLLSAGLDGAVGLRAVEARRVLATVRDLSAGDVEPLALAEELGAGTFVTGSLVSSGGQLRIRAQRVDAATGEEMASAQASGDAEAAFDMVDKVTRDLIAESYRGPTPDLSGRLTRSVAALKAYLVGEQAYLDSDSERAFEAFSRALALDSAFALAAYRYAMARYREGGTASAAEALRLVRLARQSPDRLGPVSPEHLDMLEGHIVGNRDLVERTTEEILTRRPGDTDAWYFRAETFYHFNPYRGESFTEARDLFSTVIALEPGYRPAINHLLEFAYRDADSAAVDTLVPEAGIPAMFVTPAFAGDDPGFDAALERLPPGGDMLLSHYLTIALLDPHRAEQVARVSGQPGAPKEAQAASYKYRAYLRAGMGRFRDASLLLDSLETLDRSSAVVHRALLSLPPLPSDPAMDPSALETAVRELELDEVPVRALPVDTYLESREIFEAARPYLLGLFAATRGDTVDAERHAATLEALQVPDTHATLGGDLAAAVRAELARREGRYDGAARILTGARRYVSVESSRESPFATQVRGRFLLAEALAREEEYQKAIRWLEGVMAGWMPYDVAYYALSLKRRAELLERTGRPDSAATLYARFVDWWADADSELQPLVDEVRGRIARIERSRPAAGGGTGRAAAAFDGAN